MTELKLELPNYDQEAFKKRYEELSQYTAPIPGDLIPLGDLGISKLFAEVQRYLERVNELATESERWYAEAKAVTDATKAAFEAKRDAKLAAKIQEEYESIKLLEAQVNTELAEEKRLMQRAKLTAGLFAAYRKSVQGKYKTLRAAKDTLDEQSKIYLRQRPPVNIHNANNGV